MALDSLPIVMIPAASLLCLTFNNRLIPLLGALKQLAENKCAIKGAESNYLLRVTCLRVALLFQYFAILIFTLAAFFIILSTIAPTLVYIIVILLISGCSMVFFGVISAIVEISYATTIYDKCFQEMRKEMKN